MSTLERTNLFLFILIGDVLLLPFCNNFYDATAYAYVKLKPRSESFPIRHLLHLLMTANLTEGSEGDHLIRIALQHDLGRRTDEIDPALLHVFDLGPNADLARATSADHDAGARD